MPVEELRQHPTSILFAGASGGINGNIAGKTLDESGNTLLAFVQLFRGRAICGERPGNGDSGVQQRAMVTLQRRLC